MHTISHKHYWIAFVWLNFAAVTAMGRPTCAATPINVEMTLATGSTLVQGEPVVLHYKITNAADQDASARLGTEDKEWYTIKVIDSAGKHVPSRIESRPLQVWEKGPRGVTVQSHRFQQGYLVSKYLFALPGKYTLSVHVRLPYGLVTESNTVKREPLEKEFTEVYENDYSFPLTLMPANENRLRANAEALERAASNRGQSWHPAFIQALCSIPEEQAWPSWQALADDPSVSESSKVELAKQLVLLHTNKAMDILASMVWNPAQPLGGPVSAADWLMQAYISGDDQLRKHIKDIYARYNVPFPKHPSVTQVYD